MQLTVLLAKVFGQLMDNMDNRTLVLSTTLFLLETRAWLLDTFSSTELDKLNNLLFQFHLYFCANLA